MWVRSKSLQQKSLRKKRTVPISMDKKRSLALIGCVSDGARVSIGGTELSEVSDVESEVDVADDDNSADDAAGVEFEAEGIGREMSNMSAMERRRMWRKDGADVVEVGGDVEA